MSSTKRLRSDSDSTRIRTITVLAPASEYDAISAAAKSDGRSRSSWLLRAAREQMARDRKTKFKG